MNKKLVIFVVLLVAVGLTLGISIYLKRPSIPPGTVFVSGNIEAIEVDLSFRIAGQINSLPIMEGDRVSKGQIVATLDTDSLEALQGGAQSEIATATAVLDELEAGYREEEIKSARALAKAAESRLANARDEYERHLNLFKGGAISASVYDSKETSFKVATEEYNNAVQRLTELERGPREEQIRAARSRLERAKWELKRIELDIKHSSIESPINGVVLVKANELGEVILPGATVATVAEIDEVWLKGYVGEKDLGKIKLGQKANITIDTYPDRSYQGIVTFISTRAEFTPKNVQTREERIKQVYRVKITIPNQHQDLKIGMPAEGYIIADESLHESKK
ncbi:MAG: efflux RND transporter periplasmic adaptor subunit, partial [Syntrophaceae bacterium]|nr:efflux RND transporter periplasmic adaptor subunit [Syntrophaceae bacterium]